MNLHTKQLKNGLTIQAVEMPGTNVVTALILVGAGSRYEDTNNLGISHFLEHMFFKGGKKYQTPKEVSAAIDGVGGVFNAFTGKECVGYYVKSGKESLDIALSVLGDMLLEARFPKEEIEKERGVILEEMAMYLDLPTYQVSWDFERVLFGDQPLGRDQIGEKEIINRVNREDFLSYRNSLYAPQNIVITLAGAVTKSDIERVEAYFTFKEAEVTKKALPFDDKILTEKYRVREKQTEQYHMSFGVRGIPEQDTRYPTLKILETILGGNMSSRMFQNIREEKGLCYSIRTEAEGFTDAGIFTTRAGIKLEKILDATEAMRKEYDVIAEKGIEPEELQKAQAYVKGKIDLGTEDTEGVAMHYAKNKLFYKLEDSFEDEKNKISLVTKEGVDTLAQELLQPERYHIALIGPHIDEKKLLELLS